MTTKRKPQPKLYDIQTFQLRRWKEGVGILRNYTVAANSRAQAIRIIGLDSGEAILKILCIGNRITSVEHWEKKQ